MKKIAIVLPLFALALTLASCSSEGAPEPEVTASSTPSPEATAEVFTATEKSSLPYEPAPVSEEFNAVFPVSELPFEPQGYAVEDQITADAPVVDMAALSAWVDARVAEGWTLDFEEDTELQYSATLTRDGETLVLFSFKSVEQPFTSISYIAAS